MLCQRCQNAQATVHIDEVNSFKGAGHSENEVEEHHLCEQCAQEAEIPHIAVQQKTMDEVWKLLQMSAMKAQKKETPKKTLTCVGCGTTLEQLRRKGRVGCQTCYTTFSQYLQGLLERMHGSTHHVGRVPGVNSDELERQRQIEAAQADLDRAISEEKFERAAELRDELNLLAQTDASREDDSASATS
ncbi:MAG: protein arginine kinase activator [Planctomycetota bacterium]|jgi:protein arginine kinase activator